MENEEIKPAKIGDIIEGRVVGIDRSSVFIDLGAIGTGIIFGREFQEAKSRLRNIKKGETISAKIVDLENEEGYIELSAREAEKENNWKNIREIKDKEEKIKVKIIGANKGGLLAEINGLAAFMPVSQLSFQHYPHIEGDDRSQIVKKLQQFIGQELEAKVISYEPEQEKLIISEKASEMENVKEDIKKYKIGDVIKGEITKITDFGAFIRFSLNERFLEGLIHISELDWEIVENPSQIVKVGEKIKAKIVNLTEDKIFLSLKALKKDPWEDVEKEYKKGDKVKGKVVKLDSFGALVQLTKSKIQALCHISEFGTKNKMEDKIKEGEEYSFKILSVNPKEHKMSLSLAE